MDTYNASMLAHFQQLLARREAELRLLLRNAGHPAGDAGGAATRDVVDFKELATEQTQATVDDAKTTHAVRELDQLAAARLRLADLSYGLCLECGDDIDLRRLEALPATPYCTGCQGLLEQGRLQHSRR